MVIRGLRRPPAPARPNLGADFLEHELLEIGSKHQEGWQAARRFPLAWFVLVGLVLMVSLDELGLEEFGSPRSLTEANLHLLVEVTETGVAFSVFGVDDLVQDGVVDTPGRGIQSGRCLWLARLDSGLSKKDLGRAARDILGAARLARGASSSTVIVEIRKESGVRWLDLSMAADAFETGLSPRPHFEAPSQVLVASNIALFQPPIRSVVK